MKQKENIFEELNKMRSLIHAKAGVVISEQDTYSPIQKANELKQKIQNLANIQKTVDAQGIIKNPNSEFNNTKFSDYIAKYNITQNEIDYSKKLTKIQKVTDDNTQKRLQNISNISKMVNADGMIVNPNSVYNNTPWADYIKRYNVTQDEINKSNELNKKVAPATPAAGVRTPETIKAINSTFCNVRGGKINSGLFQGQPWSNYKTKYSVTAAEEVESQKSCPTVQTGIVTGSVDGKNNRANNYARIVGDYSKQIQSSLGSSPTGKMSSQDLDLILKRLNGEDVSVEVPQELPKDANGKPDLDKILASLQN